MFAFTERPKLLLKLRGNQSPAAGQSRFSMNGGKTAGFDVTLEPLLRTATGAPRAARGPGRWWTAEFASKDMGAGGTHVNTWDMCHALMSGDANINGADIEFAEPDLEQQWLPEPRPQHELGFGASSGPNDAPADQDTRYNTAEPNHWFRNARHSQLDQARTAVGDITDGNRVRIAHFDTGFDPGHATVPLFLDTVLQRNFVSGEDPHDATDRSHGLTAQYGHGTGTLGILAGKSWGTTGSSRLDLGGAPFARVVPIRVANSVVLFRTSAIAQAFHYVSDLCRRPETRVDVVTMSMGGLASAAWAEAINRAYDAGIFIVAAAGNNFGNAPTRYLVYPARFNRVVAACGVQARNENRFDPYAELPLSQMAGNYGPKSKMGEAMAAFTPNIPWARILSGNKVDFDGGGTSSATPQIAAAAAIWIQKHQDALAGYTNAWMRVEAVRHALFNSARKTDADPADNPVFFGNGVLRARDALAIGAPDVEELEKAEKDDARWALIRGLGGLGIAADVTHPPGRMLELELLQATQSSALLAQALLEAENLPDEQKRKRFKEAVAEESGLSRNVRKWLDSGHTPPTTMNLEEKHSKFLERERLKHARAPLVDKPAMRRLQVYTSDPSAEGTTAARKFAHTTISLPWQDLKPGPVDDYFEVVDADPTSGSFYAPVDLDHKNLLATDGLPPSESDPRFHQQMVYAVARTTVARFEEALGRPALWSSRRQRVGGKFVEQFVRRLRIYPHALREQNAYYSPDKKALLFGYFREGSNVEEGVAPGSTVFTCLSYDIVAHETAHALLDGLHRRYAETSNPDTRAFHEAFSDLVALFQHFSHEEALRGSIAAATSKSLDFDTQFTSLAVQFGRSQGLRGALRSALGMRWDDKTGRLVRTTLNDVGNQQHDRGAVLVAAMFDAFLDIYRRRSADLIRIATVGTGILPAGEIHPDLVHRLANEATKTAHHILRLSIRALDYCPSTSVTFGDYLRAVITSDFDMYPDDPLDYRTAIVSAFRGRAIHPEHVQSISAKSLCWHPPEVGPDVHALIRSIIDDADSRSKFRNWRLETERRQAFELARQLGGHFRNRLQAEFTNREKRGHDEAERLGFVLDTNKEIQTDLVPGARLSRFEVHSVRPARRLTAAGQERLDLIIEVTQALRSRGMAPYRGGATWVVSCDTGEIRYCIRKRIDNISRIVSEHGFRQSVRTSERGNYYSLPGNPPEPFAASHRGEWEVAQ